MPISKPGITREEAAKWLKSFNSMYLVVGYKSDGYRGIPATFNTMVIAAQGSEEVGDIIKSFTDFRVFEIATGRYSDDWWKIKAENKEKNDTEAKERALLQKLKDKYESK